MELTSVTCKNCGTSFTGKYCNNCGEKVYTDKDKHLGHFFEESFHFITHFEGTFFTTVKTLFTSPGKVSVDYTAGVRKKYFKLLSLFLLLVILYLLFPFFEGLNMKLYYHTQNLLYGTYAKAKVMSIMQERHITETVVTELFQKKSATVSKTFLVLIIPLTALAFWAVTYKRRKYFFDQMVFATEIKSMYLLWGFLVLPLLITIVQLIYGLFQTGYIPLRDGIIGFFISIPLAVYTARASRRFYNFKKWQSILFSLFYIVVTAIVVHYIYKFILFLTVINLI